MDDGMLVILVSLVVVLFVFALFVWTQRNKEGALWVKIFGVQAHVEQKAALDHKPVSQTQEGGVDNQQKVETVAGVEVSQTQRGGTNNRQSVKIGK